MWEVKRVFKAVWYVSTLFSRKGFKRRIAGSEKSIMVTDPIADMLIRIKNGSLVKKSEVEVAFSKLKEAMAKKLFDEGYLAKVKVEEKAGKKFLVMGLRYEGGLAAVEGVERVSKPGRKVYVKLGEIPKVAGGKGLVVMNTSVGVMTGEEARKAGVGGEVLAKIW